MASAFFLSTLLLLGTTNAQSTSNNTRYTYLDVTFSDPGARDCGQGTTGEGNAVTFSVTSPGQGSVSTCFNLNETFTQTNITYSTAGYSCLNGVSCGVNYTLAGAQHFNNDANYSQIFYRQNSFPVSSNDDPDNADDRVGRLRFQTYSHHDCIQGDQNNDNETDPWYRWDCNNVNGTCGTVPYSVRSFRLLHVEQDDQADSGCVVDAVYGAGARPKVQGGLVALLFACTLAVMFLQ